MIDSFVRSYMYLRFLCGVSNLGELLYSLVIFLWLHADVNRIRSFVIAQECLRINGVQRLMAYSNGHLYAYVCAGSMRNSQLCTVVCLGAF